MNIPTPHKWLRDHIPYEAGLADDKDISPHIAIHKLSANESALGASPKAKQAFIRMADELNRYPDFSNDQLRQAIAVQHHINPDQIVIGNGSDELISLLIHAYGGVGKSIIMSQYGFSYYGIAAQAAGMKVRHAPESPQHALNLKEVIALCDKDTSIVFIANPNNPTGTLLTKNDIHDFLEHLPSSIILVLDGAYAEYVMADNYDAGISFVSHYPNVVMLRTFSKIYGLSALRLGWGYAPPAIAHLLNRLRAPFNINRAAQEAGTAAMNDQEFIKKVRKLNAQRRDFFSQEVTKIGIDTHPSHGNFLLLAFPDKIKTARDANLFLKKRGVLLRTLEPYGLHNHLRITIGAQDSLTLALDGLRQFMTT